MKVSPKAFFEYFPAKDFDEECRTHARVAAGTEHIVDIREMLSADVVFGDTVLKCQIAELQYVAGELLEHYLSPGNRLSARTAAQIAVDLLRIREELQKKGVYHNDLHAANIVVQQLGPDATRGEAIDDSVRAVAIDLGSVSDKSKSDSGTSRLGDLHQIAAHLSGLVGGLLRDPDKISDRENRVARALQVVVQTISPPVERQRTPKAADLIRQIEDAYHHATRHWRPWREPLVLKTFSASYNAQTMHAWHVPRLLVDPAGQWLNRISAPGPQVITGMRGCGKTMLLRALQFHARAAPRGDEANEGILKRLTEDNYVGLFVSAQRLLNRLGEEDAVEEQNPFERLLLTYGLEAARAVSHLRDIDRSAVSELAHRSLWTAVAACIEGLDLLGPISSLEDLDRRLEDHLILLNRAEQEHVLHVAPHVAFCRLSKALRECSSVWGTARVLFLLDDVSTRYLKHSRIEEILSTLLFQDATCAFKLTSERQTLALGLKSPGRNHPVRVGRDLSVFDLGAEVYEKIKKPGKANGRHFVERILSQRAECFAGHPQVAPSVLLGDVELEQLAAEIGQSESDARRSREKQRKGIYHGITALARVCVGDIGDVVSLYEQILKNAGERGYPVAREIQSECFQDFCARRLYDLNRRKPFLMDVAKSFAEASHSLLVASYRQGDVGNRRRRLRQYLSLYVRITTGDFERQSDQLRELIDAGVFVFAGGSHVPRAKTRDSDPMQQFKLTYRKIYGLVNFIGLAERDRFELSGEDLEHWLAEPKKGKEILLRNQGKRAPRGRTAALGNVTVGASGAVGKDRNRAPGVETEEGREPTQGLLVPTTLGAGAERSEPIEMAPDPGRHPSIDYVEEEIIRGVPIDCVVVGLGFEERTLESARRLCSWVGARSAVAVRYREKGKREEIRSLLRQTCKYERTYAYEDVIGQGIPACDGDMLVDITGLAKPVIFHAIRNQLRKLGRVWICYTEAERYYPLDDDLKAVLTRISHSSSRSATTATAT
ncbi:MAG: hypothetical protein OXH63_28240, partial [Gemmatimonadetes bacterium]|nr:hypothetical protein [Gemmatimonadota bacterium]